MLAQAGDDAVRRERDLVKPHAGCFVDCGDDGGRERQHRHLRHAARAPGAQWVWTFEDE